MKRQSSPDSRFPPLHPAVVHFPVALVTFSVAADLAGFFLDSRSLLNAAWWALAAATAGAAVSVVSGLLDMNREDIEHKSHQYVHIHMKIGFVLFVSVAALTFWRWMIYMAPARAPGTFYLTAAVVVLVLTLFQGWIGGELVYSHGVGVAPTGQGTTSAAKAQQRLAWLPGGAGDEANAPDPKSSRSSASTGGHEHH